MQDTFSCSRETAISSNRTTGSLPLGRGGPYALAAARALLANTSLTAAEVAERAMQIAAGICVYTNSQIVLEEI